MTYDSGDHLDGAQVAAFLDSRLDSTERREVEAHLEGCERCRAEVIEVSRLLDTGSTDRRRARAWKLVPVGAVAAAAVLLFVLLQPFGVADLRENETPPQLRVRGEGVAELGVVSPRDGASAAPQGPFIWRAAAPDALYRFRITDEAGRVLSTVTTEDTVLVLPAGSTLRDGESYYWNVDVLLGDGRFASTGHQRFRVDR